MFISAKTCGSQLRKKTDIVQLSTAISKYSKVSHSNFNSFLSGPDIKRIRQHPALSESPNRSVCC